MCQLLTELQDNAVKEKNVDLHHEIKKKIFQKKSRLSSVRFPFDSAMCDAIGLATHFRDMPSKPFEFRTGLPSCAASIAPI